MKVNLVHFFSRKMKDFLTYHQESLFKENIIFTPNIIWWRVVCHIFFRFIKSNTWTLLKTALSYFEKFKFCFFGSDEKSTSVYFNVVLGWVKHGTVYTNQIRSNKSKEMKSLEHTV